MIQLLVTTFSNAAVYALIAVSLNVVYRSTGMVNFGAGYMCAFAALTYSNVLPANVLGVLGTVVFGALLSLAGYLVGTWWGQRHHYDPVSLSLTLLGAGMVLDFLAARIWGVHAFSARPLISGTVTIGGTTFNRDRILMVVVAAVFVGAVVWFVEHTMIGHALEATAADPELAGLYGVRTGAAMLVAWGLAGAAAGLAGAVQANLSAITMASGLSLVILGTAAAVVGGLGSLRNAVLGAIAVALVQAAFVLYVSSSYTQSVVFLLLFVVLAVRPQGLFVNSRQAERV